MCRLPIKRLSKVQIFWSYLGTSKCWGISVLQTPALVNIREAEILYLYGRVRVRVAR